VSAPSPANAICPSETCPAQPMRIVIDTPQIANARTVAYRRWRDGWVTISGSTTAAARNTANVSEPMCRIHHRWSRWAGIGRLAGVNE